MRLPISCPVSYIDFLQLSASSFKRNKSFVPPEIDRVKQIHSNTGCAVMPSALLFLLFKVGSITILAAVSIR
jgi:hypothetical protein